MTPEQLEQKADRAAFEHTVFMALADIYTQVNPGTDIGDFLLQLQDNKKAEKNRILNEIIRNKN